MKKVLPVLLFGSFVIVNAQSGTVTLEEQFNTSGISNSAPSYQPEIELPVPKTNLFSDWGQEPAISPDITPQIEKTIKEIKTGKEPDKVQEVIDEMFPNKIPVSYEAPIAKTLKPIGQKPTVSAHEYQGSKKHNSFNFNGLLNVLAFSFLGIGILLFFVWFLSKNKVDVKFDVATTPKTKDNYISYSKREVKLKETLIESAKQALVLDLREMEIRGMIDDREITIKTLLRAYEEISLSQLAEYSKVVNISKIEVERIIKETYRLLNVQYSIV